MQNLAAISLTFWVILKAFLKMRKIKERYFLWLELITLIWIRIFFLHNRNVVTPQTIKKLKIFI